MKLRRVYETAEEEGKSVEEIAVDRFGSLELFEEAKLERQILDEREGKRGEFNSSRKPRESAGEKRLMFTDIAGSGASSRSSSFRRPEMGGSTPATPTPASRPTHPRFDSLRLPSQGDSPSHTPVPTVMTPSASTAHAGSSRSLSPSSLNKLQAKVLRAKLMGAPDADKLQAEYDQELQRASSGEESNVHVQVLPTLDSRGRLYDVGHGKDDGELLPGNKRKKDPKVSCSISHILVSWTHP